MRGDSSVHNLPIHHLVVESFEMWNVHGADRLNGGQQSLLRRPRSLPVTRLLSRRSQDPKDARAIEPLTFTVVAKAHDRI